MVSKTRERLIEVASQLFVRKGVENTTMLDIANASEKGRRTIYTYFKNKKEIQQAIIERESEQMVSRLRKIAKSSSGSAAEKLDSFLVQSFELSDTSPSGRNHEYLSWLKLLEGNRAGKTRRMALLKQIDILKEILNEGVDSGEFNPQAAEQALPLLTLLIHSRDSDSQREILKLSGVGEANAAQKIIRFVISSITIRN